MSEIYEYFRILIEIILSMFLLLFEEQFWNFEHKYWTCTSLMDFNKLSQWTISVDFLFP